MNQYDDQWLRDGLAAAVPTPPEAADRAQRATVEARRGRRVRAAGVLGAAAVVVAAAVAWTVSGDGPDRAADPAGTPTLACPTAGGEDPTGAEATGRAGRGVRPGASTARLCVGEGNPFDPPADALVTGLDDLAATVNELEPYPAEVDGCVDNLGSGYRIVFGYPDGSTTVVAGHPHFGCEELSIGGDDFRTDPQVPKDKFVELLRKQRASADQPTASPAGDLSCVSQAPGSPVGLAAEMTRAVYCSSEGAEPIAIPPADLEVLAADMHRPGPIGVTRACLPSWWIVGLTPWGDRVETRPLCGGDRWTLENDLAWSVSPASTAILDRLAAKPG